MLPEDTLLHTGRYAHGNRSYEFALVDVGFPERDGSTGIEVYPAGELDARLLRTEFLYALAFDPEGAVRGAALVPGEIGGPTRWDSPLEVNKLWSLYGDHLPALGAAVPEAYRSRVADLSLDPAQLRWKIHERAGDGRRLDDIRREGLPPADL